MNNMETELTSFITLKLCPPNCFPLIPIFAGEIIDIIQSEGFLICQAKMVQLSRYNLLLSFRVVWGWGRDFMAHSAIWSHLVE